MFFKMILALFRKNKLTFIEKKEEKGDVVTFLFKGEEKTTWLPGQHGIFSPDHVKIKRSMRAFSIASIPEEGQVMISMKVPSNPSEFKQAFLSLQTGEYRNEASYFITGPVTMVKNLKNTLKSQGIFSKNIKTDLFIGYK